MRTVALSVVIFSALLGAPAWAKGKTKPKAKDDVVVLGFGWPTGLSADVTYRWTRSKTGKPAQGFSLTGRLGVAAEGENLRVGYRDWKKDGIDNSPAAASLPSLDKIATVVDKKGAVVRVDGTVSPDDALRIATPAPGATNPGSEATKQVAQMIPKLFQQSAAKTWEMLVESWAGVDLEIGRDYETEDEAPVPLVPGGKLKTNFRVRAERRLDCPGQPEKRCVELKLRSEPDHESMAKLVESLGATFGTKGLGTAGDMSAVEEFTLVTEPDRLIPHSLDVTKTVEVHDPSAGGTVRSQQIDRTTWTYRYPSAPTPTRPPSR